MATSIKLSEELTSSIEKYRVQIFNLTGKIPKLSEAIRDLLKKALSEKEIVKEENNKMLFTDKTVSVEKSRGRFMIRFNPEDYKHLTEKFGEVKKADVILQPITE